MNESFILDFEQTLRTKGITIVCAESITAGLFASTIASVSGSSDVFLGSIVTYSRLLKSSLLDVHPSLIDKYMAESKETTREMAYGLSKLCPIAEIWVAVTGVASEPATNSGYVVDKKAGQIYIAVYYKNKIYEKELMSGERERNRIREDAVAEIMHYILSIV